MISQEFQDLYIRSLESTLHKLSTAYESMTEKGSNTALVKMRRDAVKTGLESLRCDWNAEEFICDDEIMLTSIKTLQGIVPSIEKQLVKAKDGSSQKTLNERRLTAINLSVESLKNRFQ
ncbi:hypothetical protein SporoP37_00645 [Sporosarcina sp. P37]|uniref:hypothetical protein n=1 Tax=unclassified Sporosarcina TaxID=2647733 RepID=UPI000A17D1F8|nr:MULTISPECIES: hypothetical protein [unclassified Sporosarcina]ARK23344.1 hypothetical protein SporoP37_00645 [Sporosarcina sp. P37]